MSNFARLKVILFVLNLPCISYVERKMQIELCSGCRQNDLFLMVDLIKVPISPIIKTNIMKLLLFIKLWDLKNCQ